MPIPDPQSGQSREEYVYGTCVPFLVGEGRSREQAIAICNDRYGKQKAYRPRKWSTIDRRKAGFRRKYRPKIKKALDEHIQQIFDKIDSTNDLQGLPSTIEQMPLRSEMIKDTIKELWINVGSEFAIFDRRQAQKSAEVYQTKSEEDIYSEIIANDMQKFINDHVGEKIESVSGTTRELVKKKLKEIIPNLYESGMSSGEMQRALRSQIQDEWLTARKYRIERIVRTETTGASSVGSMKGVDSTGIPHMKIWNAAFMDTRVDHQDAHGQKVDMKNSFWVGGQEMRYPGDPNGSPGNVINCNCTMSYEVKKGQSEEIKDPHKLPTAARDALRKVEGQIGDNEYETAYVVDNSGSQILKKVGGRRSVSFSGTEAENFYKGYFTHNHPSGTGLSSSDIELLIEKELNEIRAVNKNKNITSRMSLDIDKMQEYGGSNAILKAFRGAYEKYQKQIREEMQDKIDKDIISPEQAKLGHYKRLWEDLTSDPAFKPFLKYSEEKFGG